MKNVTLESAVRSAIDTARDQRREVPELPADWIERAEAALESKNEAAILAVGREIATAHNQYRAEFDVKGWLYDLRVVLWSIREKEKLAAAVAIRQA